MEFGEKRSIPGIARAVAAVDPIEDLINKMKDKVVFYAADPIVDLAILEVMKLAKRKAYVSFVQADEELMNLLDVAKADSDRKYVYIIEQKDIDRGYAYLFMRGILDLEVYNLIPVILEYYLADIKGLSDWYPLFKNKKDKLKVIEPFKTWGAELGKGFGKRYENKPIAYDLVVTKRIFNTWKKNEYKEQKAKE